MLYLTAYFAHFPPIFLMARLQIYRFVTYSLLLIIGFNQAHGQQFEEKAYLGDLMTYNQWPLDSLWHYQPGDKLAGANSAKWPVVDAQFLRDRAGRPLAWPGVGWFKKQWQVPPSLRNQAVALRMGHFGASEIYLDGKLLQRYGKIGTTLTGEAIWLPRQPIIVQLDGKETHWLTVHYGNHRANLRTYGNQFGGFRLLVSRPVYREWNSPEFLPMMISVMIAFSLLFGFIYCLYPARLASLFSTLCLLNYSSLFFAIYLLNIVSDGSVLIQAVSVRDIAVGIIEALFLLNIYVLYYRQLPRQAWLLIAWIPVVVTLVLSQSPGVSIIMPISLVITVEQFRILIIGIRRQKSGFPILLIGRVLGQIVFSIIVLDVFNWFPTFTYTLGILLVINAMILPLTLALHLAWEFRTANRDLEHKLEQVEVLSEQMLQQEQEKQHLLATQNETLELQVADRTAELSHKNQELVIEAALERVRSRSLAMHSSDELSEIITVVSEQLKALGVQFDYVNFIVERADRGWDCYNAAPNRAIQSFLIPYVDHKLFSQGEEAKQQGIDFFAYTLTPDEKNEWLTHLFSQTILKDAPEEFKQLLIDLPGLAASVVGWADIALSIATYSGVPFTDTENAIFKRFGAVFGQAYIRFLDLKKAEGQAREAIRTASLDRVRAQIASMRTTQDLERITPLIWNELTTLGVPFIRCGVFIMDEQQQQIHTFLSTPDGKAIASFNTSFANPGLLSEALPHWRNKEIYTTHWDEATFLEQAQTLIGQGMIASPETYLTDHRPTSLYLHLLPFLQGMLYVGNDTTPLTDDQLSLVQTLADAFSTAYARYEDFNKLDEAKKLAESTLTELKVTQTQLIQKEKMASLGELTAGIAHEIQNPLNFVNNFSEVSTELVEELREEETKANRDPELIGELLDDLSQNLQKITHHGGRASSIVKGMLEHSRTATGEREPTDLNALADEYLRLAYQGIRRSGDPAKDKGFNAELITNFAPDLGEIAVVPQEIGRVLLNLYNNAFYAVREKQKTAPADYHPTVWVSTHRVADAVEIRVKDNGAGIPDDIKAKIFQPFFTTKPTGEGTGLGLSLSYDIVTKGHGGTLTVESMVGKGTTFVINLPA